MRGGIVGELPDDLGQFAVGQGASEDAQQRHVVLLRDALGIARTAATARSAAPGSPGRVARVVILSSLPVVAAICQALSTRVGKTCSKLTILPKPEATITVMPSATASAAMRKQAAPIAV